MTVDMGVERAASCVRHTVQQLPSLFSFPKRPFLGIYFVPGPGLRVYLRQDKPVPPKLMISHIVHVRKPSFRH